MPHGGEVPDVTVSPGLIELGIAIVTSLASLFMAGVGVGKAKTQMADAIREQNNKLETLSDAVREGFADAKREREDLQRNVSELTRWQDHADGVAEGKRVADERRHGPRKGPEYRAGEPGDF